jgi:hypothetical protein
MYWVLSELRHNMNHVPHYEPDGSEVFNEGDDVRRALSA